MSIIEHLERELGPMARGWKTRTPGVQISRFDTGPRVGDITLATIGLHRHELTMPRRTVRQELVVSIAREIEPTPLLDILDSLSAEIVRRHEPLLRGDTVRLGGVPIPKTRTVALYVSAPVFFSNAFAEDASTSPPTVIAMLLALVGGERDWIRTHGWDSFEKRLERSGVDALDLSRRSVVED